MRGTGHTQARSRVAFSLVLLVALAHTTAIARAAAAPKHVIFFLIDDLGFGDASYKAAIYPDADIGKIPTPHIDKLANAGVRLESYYVNQLCSPTRTSLLSGRYAYTIGMNGEVIVDGNPDVMPLNITTVADHLQKGGWATSAYGKWDAGMTNWGSTPTCRGFDHFSGFYNAVNDYFKHRVGVGLDLRNDTKPDFANNNETGIYMTELVTTRVVEWINSVHAADPDKPSFAYVAHEAVHGPVQVPEKYIDGACASLVPLDFPLRRMLCGMLQAVDESVANITQAYADLGILEDTLIIFSTDNGGQPSTGGNNYPLRGCKATTFEGGMRGLGFVSGAGLQPNITGSVYNGIVHVSDWLPTIVEGFAGLPMNISGEIPLDGVNQWGAISKGMDSNRTEVLLNLIPTGCHPNAPACNVQGQYAIRVNQWKLLYGHTTVYPVRPSGSAGQVCTARIGDPSKNTFPLNVTAETSNPWCPNGWVLPPESSRLPIPPPDVNCTSLPCDFPDSDYMTGGVFLFDVVSDPTEQKNVAAENPDIVKALLARLEFYNSTHIPQSHGGQDPRSNPMLFGEVWTPWEGDPDPSKCSKELSPVGLVSNFDGFHIINGSVELQGWAWNRLQADGGIAPINIDLFLDDQHLVKVLANIPRAGLPSKTGAPNTEHGFLYKLTAAEQATFSKGHHVLRAEYLPGGAPIPLNGSPSCAKNSQEAPC